MPPETAILSLSADAAAARTAELAALLHACVRSGASISFVLPFEPPQAEAFWSEKVLPDLRAGTRLLLVAEADGRLVGTVQLGIDTPPNQPHRAEVSKLLVDPAFRRRGVARALMAELVRRSRALGRTLITLDTRSGDGAEPLYASLGFRAAGVIPGYSIDPHDPTRFDSTTVMYLQAAPPAPSDHRAFG